MVLFQMNCEEDASNEVAESKPTLAMLAWLEYIHRRSCRITQQVSLEEASISKRADTRIYKL